MNITEKREFIARRSESDMLSMAPVKVRLGSEDYLIPVLNNRKASEWRVRLFDAMAPLVSNFDFSGIDLNERYDTVQNAMSRRLSDEMKKFPERLLDLLFDYAPELPADKIRDEASDEQIGLAFAKVAEVGYPFFFHLWATKRTLAMPPEPMPPVTTRPQ